MDFSPSLIWFLLGVVFLITELFVPGFILIFFTAGCWLAGLIAWLTDINLTIQIAIFSFSSLVCLFSLRKFSMKIFTGEARGVRDDGNKDSGIGKTALVTKTISVDRPGEIKAMGSFWRAVADSGIEEGRTVIIESRTSDDGLTYKVKLL